MHPTTSDLNSITNKKKNLSLAFLLFQCTMFVGGRRRECRTSSVIVGGGRACSQRWPGGDLALSVAPVARGLLAALIIGGDYLGCG